MKKNESLNQFCETFWATFSYSTVDKFLIPGNYFPSNNSIVAPPPVETKLSFSSTPNLLTKLAESPPPIIVVVPFFVALIILLSIPSLPFLKCSTSMTPIGPFQKIDPALDITSSNIFYDSGPISKV
jgi:hypothetical protein